MHIVGVLSVFLLRARRFGVKQYSQCQNQFNLFFVHVHVRSFMWPYPVLRFSHPPLVIKFWTQRHLVFVSWSCCQWWQITKLIQNLWPHTNITKFLKSVFESQKTCCAPEHIYSDNAILWWGRPTYYATKTNKDYTVWTLCVWWRYNFTRTLHVSHAHLCHAMKHTYKSHI